MKILTVFGTRPEAIKLAPVIQLLSKIPHVISKVCVTGQHRHMLDQVLSLFKIIPDFDLNIMSPRQSLNHIVQMTLEGLDKILNQYQPDWVVVQGDTNTTFAASLSAFYRKIAVAHVEAGLRTYNIYAPWPEELNRQCTSRIATLHFAPTVGAKNNLLREGISENNIVITGNTGIDALLQTVNHIQANSHLSKELGKILHFLKADKKLLLITSHRRENFGVGVQELCQALRTLAERDDIQIAFPVHLNPNVSDIVHNQLNHHKNIYLIPPQDYLPFVYLMMQAYLILTDSGGIQEEAPTLGKPVLVFRDKTERPEGITSGSAKLIGTQTASILQHVEMLLTDRALYEKMATISHPYGDGCASQRIVEQLLL